jgi:hypothetical protein
MEELVVTNLIPISKLDPMIHRPRLIGEVRCAVISHSCWHNYFADDMIQLLAYPIRKYTEQ